MPQILDRDEEHARRKQRLAKQKKGPGVFVYDGTACDTESIPTYLVRGKSVPVYDAHGVPRVDATGRPLYEREGTPVLDEKGRPQLGGTPRLKKIPLDTFKIRGVAFPKGKAIEVENPALALKLRCMGHFEEVDGGKGDAPDAGAVGALGKVALLKLATNLGLEADKGMSQRAIAVLIRSHLEAAEPKDEGDALMAMSKAELVNECEKRGIEIRDGRVSRDTILELLKGGEVAAG